jgi:flagellar biosynthesis/type III secretory pathway protein FliH
MLFTEYDRDTDIAVNRREAWEEGREEGIELGLYQGREEGIELGLSQGREEILKLFEQGLSVEEIKELLN